MDSSEYVSRAIMLALNRAPEYGVLIPAERLYPSEFPPKPARPFGAVGLPVAVPFGASCMDGSSITLAVHSYTETRGEGAETVSGRLEAAALNRVVSTALDGAVLDLAEVDAPVPATAYVTWTGSNVVRDGDGGAFHGICSIRVDVSS